MSEEFNTLPQETQEAVLLAIREMEPPAAPEPALASQPGRSESPSEPEHKLDQVWAETMEIYRNGKVQLKFSPEIALALEEYQKLFMPDVGRVVRARASEPLKLWTFPPL